MHAQQLGISRSSCSCNSNSEILVALAVSWMEAAAKDPTFMDESVSNTEPTIKIGNLVMENPYYERPPYNPQRPKKTGKGAFGTKVRADRSADEQTNRIAHHEIKGKAPQSLFTSLKAIFKIKRATSKVATNPNPMSAGQENDQA